MEPDDRQCNPLLRAATSTRTISIVLGAVMTMITIAYTTTRAATQGTALKPAGNYVRLTQEDESDAEEQAYIDDQPFSRREMRAEALRSAVASGSLPPSALEEDSDEDDVGNYSSKNDENASTKYSYSLFHIVFLGATMWVASLLTQNLDPEASQDGLAPVGRTYWASWVKIISAWVCYTIYLWSLIAPVLMPDRFEMY